MSEEKTKTPKPKPRFPRPSTLLNHVEAYCQDNDLGQEDTIDNLVKSIERDIVLDARRG